MKKHWNLRLDLRLRLMLVLAWAITSAQAQQPLDADLPLTARILCSSTDASGACASDIPEGTVAESAAWTDDQGIKHLVVTFSQPVDEQPSEYHVAFDTAGHVVAFSAVRDPGVRHSFVVQDQKITSFKRIDYSNTTEATEAAEATEATEAKETAEPSARSVAVSGETTDCQPVRFNERYADTRLKSKSANARAQSHLFDVAKGSMLKILLMPEDDPYETFICIFNEEGQLIRLFAPNYFELHGRGRNKGYGILEFTVENDRIVQVSEQS